MGDVNVSGITLQTATWNVYYPGCQFTEICDTGPCPDSCQACTFGTGQRQCNTNSGFTDWWFANQPDRRSQCTLQPECSEVYAGTCPTMSGGTATAQWNSNSDQSNSLGQGRQIVCTYKASDFQTAADITTWINTFGTTGNSEAFDNIMSFFCSQQAVNCQPFAPLASPSAACTGGLTGCSMFSDTGQGGAYCRNWASSPSPITYSTEQNFCVDNICAQDCLCYNRGEVDDIYIQITSSPDAPPPTEDACWYKPCQQTQYLIPQNQIIQPGTCPSTICQQVNNVIGNQGSNINITVAQEEISCTLGTGGGGNNPLGYIESIWDQYHVWIIVGIAIILTAVTLFIVITIILKSRSKHTDPTDSTTNP